MTMINAIKITADFVMILAIESVLVGAAKTKKMRWDTMNCSNNIPLKNKSNWVSRQFYLTWHDTEGNDAGNWADLVAWRTDVESWGVSRDVI